MPTGNSLTVPLETVTPLFLAGADARGAPELRPPAFRGALRYWLRAALGGAIGPDLVALHRAESAVFGSADERLGGASAITVRIRHDTLPAVQMYARQAPISVTKGGRNLRQPSGRDYLYWSMDESGRVERGNYQPKKQFLPRGAGFDIILTPRPSTRASMQRLTEAAAALWLLVHLGGVGSRSRRTGGSLGVATIVEFAGLRFGLAGGEPGDLATQLATGLRRVHEVFVPLGNAQPAVATDFDTLDSAACSVWLLGVWPSADTAVEAIGAALRDFRTYSEPDHTEVARWLNGSPIATVERAAFGLPIPYRYTNGPAATLQARSGGQTIDRRASPLWLTVSPTASGACAGIATLFRSRFLPDGAVLAAPRAPQAPPIPPPTGYQLIERWVSASFPAAREVTYA